MMENNLGGKKLTSGSGEWLPKKKKKKKKPSGLQVLESSLSWECL